MGGLIKGGLTMGELIAGLLDGIWLQQAGA